MTTKKQRREAAAARRAAYDAETKRLGLEAQRRDREKRENAHHDALRVQRQRDRAVEARKIREAAELAKQIQIDTGVEHTLDEIFEGAE